jgi:hypothetical protein
MGLLYTASFLHLYLGRSRFDVCLGTRYPNPGFCCVLLRFPRDICRRHTSVYRNRFLRIMTPFQGQKFRSPHHHKLTHEFANFLSTFVLYNLWRHLPHDLLMRSEMARRYIYIYIYIIKEFQWPDKRHRIPSAFLKEIYGRRIVLKFLVLNMLCVAVGTSVVCVPSSTVLVAGRGEPSSLCAVHTHLKCVNMSHTACALYSACMIFT